MNTDLPVIGNDTYRNPVPFADGEKHTNPDPFVLRWCGRYYCYSTDEFGVNVSVSEDLVHWEYRGYAISDGCFHQYWAPSVIYLNGCFFMYYSSILAEVTDCHEQRMKLAKSPSPTGPFVWVKTFFNEFSIDSHPLIWKGKLYLFYSVNNWLGTADRMSGTCILMDEMISPEEFAGNPQSVILPTIKKEIYKTNRFGDGRDWYTIEGACTVCRDGRMWLIYSANAYEHEDYFLGTAVAKEKDNLYAMEWKKYPNPYTCCPLLARNQWVEGTGHNTVTKAPNMVDDWIVYHGRNARDDLLPGAEQRVMRIDPLFFSGSHLMCFGPSADDRTAPYQAGIRIYDRDIESITWLCKSPDTYRMECWIKAQRVHTGIRYGIYLNYLDEKNYTELRFHSGRRKLQMCNCRDGAVCVEAEQKLSFDFDYTVPHLLGIQRNFDHYRVTIDDELEISAYVNEICGYHGLRRIGGSTGRIGIIPYFSQITVCSFALTETALLQGRQLQNLGVFYEFPHCEIREDGLEFTDDEVVLSGRIRESGYTQEMGFAVNGENPGLEITAESGVRIGSVTGAAVGKADIADRTELPAEFSLLHVMREGKEWFLLDGKVYQWAEEKTIGSAGPVLTLRDLKIISFRYTKV